MIEWLFCITSILSLTFFLGFCFAQLFFKPKKRYVHYQEGKWLPIATLPDDISEFLVSNGKHVDVVFCRRHNSEGKVVFGFNYIATHWRPYPAPPKNR